MPIINFANSLKTHNKGTSRFLVYYLEKENQDDTNQFDEGFFNNEKDNINPEEIISKIDSNTKKLEKKHDKFYHLYVAPSNKELKNITSKSDLKDYVNKLMNEYAVNFNKGLNVNDIMYYAKIEHQRHHKFNQESVKEGYKKNGELKDGNNMHVHIIISRKTKDGKRKISPMDKTKGNGVYYLNGNVVQRGFDRNAFKIKGEELFDKMFNYDRNVSETFEYNRLKQHHPKEFKKQYGTYEKKYKPIGLLLTQKSKIHNLENIIQKSHKYSSDDKEFKSHLSKHNISIKGNSLYHNKEKFKTSDLSKTILKIIVAYNLINTYVQQLEEKKSEEEKEQNL